MDLKRCLEVLELKNATSLNQVKHAYRELVHVWHPDRFSPNSPIKQRAEEKMREINIAYEKLIAFLSSECHQDKLSLLGINTLAGPEIKHQTGVRAAKKKANCAGGKDMTKTGRARIKGVARSESAAGRRTTLSAKYVVLGLLSLLVALCALIINYLSDIDRSTLEKRPATSILKKLSPDSPKTQTATSVNATKRIKGDPIVIIEEETTSPSTSKKKYFEIYLNSGNTIIAEIWWEQNDMVMFKTKHGIMGVEKNTVKKIVSK